MKNKTRKMLFINKKKFTKYFGRVTLQENSTPITMRGGGLYKLRTRVLRGLWMCSSASISSVHIGLIIKQPLWSIHSLVVEREYLSLVQLVHVPLKYTLSFPGLLEVIIMG